MEKYSSYLFADIKSKSDSLKSAILQFIQQTCRMHNNEVLFESTPLLMDDFSITGIHFDLDKKVVYADLIYVESGDFDTLPIWSKPSTSSTLTLIDLYQLMEHLVSVLNSR